MKDGWKFKNFPESLVGLIKEKEGEFSPNVLINVKKISHRYSFEDYSNWVKKDTKDFKGLNVLSKKPHDISGRIWSVEEFVYVNETMGVITQLVTMTLIPIKDEQFIVSYTGTVGFSSDSSKDDYKELQEMLRSVKI